MFPIRRSEHQPEWRIQHRRDVLAVLWRLPLILVAAIVIGMCAAAGLWSLGRWAATLLGLPA